MRVLIVLARLKPCMLDYLVLLKNLESRSDISIKQIEIENPSEEDHQFTAFVSQTLASSVCIARLIFRDSR